MKPILLRSKEAARLCNIATKTWRTWDKLGKVPAPLTVGKLHFWRYDELLLWVDAGCPARKSWKFQSEKKTEPSKRRPIANTKP